MNDTLEFDTGLVTIRAKRWGEEGGIPTLCLHGFLDNAASFDRLAPKLHGLDIVAMDFAGHGWSDHRPLGMPYSGLSDLHDILSESPSCASPFRPWRTVCATRRAHRSASRHYLERV